ncbi:HET-domain-containing protein [Rhizodiscina lignyota]|uniref:HET-domain-containing protein n=1 Tax=Rhizodiscina lignyota TaxID=1504668 RepID=A0A9P4ISB0_9PEZI|nr:HET-domain-containing protein [Rhizodiscina lignyota]
MAPKTLFDGVEVCMVCGNLKRNNPEPRGPHAPRSESLSEWRASASEGCNSCSILVDGLQKLDKSWCAEDELCDDAHLFYSTNPLNIQLSPTDKNRRLPTRHFRWYQKPRHEKTVESIKALKFSCLRTGGAQECLEHVPKLLETCINDHIHCKGPSEAPLPTRVIAVGDPEHDEDPCLYETNGEIARYITLSHCWGDLQPLTAEKATLEERKRRIPFSALPKTFQDTLLVARKLKVEYVWIDSLCIVQDDGEDWKKEAARMASVYGNAFLSINASSAPNANGGLFYGEHHAGTGPFQIDKDITRELGDIYVRELPYGGEYPGFYHFGDESALPLYNRAWTYQEFLLPRRNLHFGKSELLWTCYTDAWCCYDYGLANRGYWKNSSKVRFMSTLQRWEGDGEPVSPWDSWTEQVQAYNAKKLTREGDRLPAFAGVARKFSEILKCRYIGGIWELNLWRQLSWFPKTSARRPAGNGAPSFSWASVDTEVQFMADNDNRNTKYKDIDLQLLDAGVKLDGPDPFSKTTEGFLTIKAPAIDVEYWRLDRRVKSTFSYLQPDMYRKSQHLISNGKSIWFWYPDDESAFEGKHSSDHIHAMNIGTGCLILESIPDRAGCFERVGILEHWGEEANALLKQMKTKELTIL